MVDQARLDGVARAHKGDDELALDQAANASEASDRGQPADEHGARLRDDLAVELLGLGGGRVCVGSGRRAAGRTAHVVVRRRSGIGSRTVAAARAGRRRGAVGPGVVAVVRAEEVRVEGVAQVLEAGLFRADVGGQDELEALGDGGLEHGNLLELAVRVAAEHEQQDLEHLQVLLARRVAHGADGAAQDGRPERDGEAAGQGEQSGRHQQRGGGNAAAGALHAAARRQDRRHGDGRHQGRQGGDGAHDGNDAAKDDADAAEDAQEAAHERRVVLELDRGDHKVHDPAEDGRHLDAGHGQAVDCEVAAHDGLGRGRAEDDLFQFGNLLQERVQLLQGVLARPARAGHGNQVEPVGVVVVVLMAVARVGRPLAVDLGRGGARGGRQRGRRGGGGGGGGRRRTFLQVEHHREHAAQERCLEQLGVEVGVQERAGRRLLGAVERGDGKVGRIVKVGADRHEALAVARALPREDADLGARDRGDDHGRVRIELEATEEDERRQRGRRWKR